MAANKGIEYPGKILIIEDDEAQHGLLHDVMEKAIPYLKTDYATTGEAAWKLATENRYEFICLDWRLGGGVQGLGLLNRFREMQPALAGAAASGEDLAGLVAPLVPEYRVCIQLAADYEGKDALQLNLDDL